MEISHRSSQIINFREAGADFRWIDIKLFDAENLGSQQEILNAVIASPWYDDDFASPSGALPDPSKGVHGPYSLQHIKAGSFREVTPRQCRAAVAEWSTTNGTLPADFIGKCTSALDERLADATAVYRLSDLGKAAKHEWGGHMATHGFLEFVIVSKRARTVAVLVASDD